MYLNLYRKFIISEKIINIEHSERMVKQCGIRRIFCDLIPRPFYSASDHNSNKNNFSFKVTNFMKWSVTLTWDFFFFETQIVMVISMRKWSIIWTLWSILRAVWSILSAVWSILRAVWRSILRAVWSILWVIWSILWVVWSILGGAVWKKLGTDWSILSSSLENTRNRLKHTLE